MIYLACVLLGMGFGVILGTTLYKKPSDALLFSATAFVGAIIMAMAGLK